jgi:hypothetical protein
LLGREHPLRFLRGGRALSSVLSKNAAVKQRFQKLHAASFGTVREYYVAVKGSVSVVDLREVVPAFAAAPELDESPVEGGLDDA